MPGAAQLAAAPVSTVQRHTEQSVLAWKSHVAALMHFLQSTCDKKVHTYYAESHVLMPRMSMLASQPAHNLPEVL